MMARHTRVDSRLDTSACPGTTPCLRVAIVGFRACRNWQFPSKSGIADWARVAEVRSASDRSQSCAATRVTISPRRDYHAKIRGESVYAGRAGDH